MVSEAICHFQARAITRRRKEWFHLRMSRTLFIAKTQLDEIAHEQTIICRKLFTGRVVGSWPMRRKNSTLWESFLNLRNSEGVGKGTDFTVATCMGAPLTGQVILINVKSVDISCTQILPSKLRIIFLS